MHLRFFILSALLTVSLSLSAQLEKTIHQTFDVADFNSISIDLIGDSTKVVSWAGNSILTETNVKLYDASTSILTHFMEKEQRYEIQADANGSDLRLTSVKKERKPIRTKNGECPENVTIRIFVPEDFEQNGSRLERKN